MPWRLRVQAFNFLAAGGRDWINYLTPRNRIPAKSAQTLVPTLFRVSNLSISFRRPASIYSEMQGDEDMPYVRGERLILDTGTTLTRPAKDVQGLRRIHSVFCANGCDATGENGRTASWR